MNINLENKYDEHTDKKGCCKFVKNTFASIKKVIARFIPSVSSLKTINS